MNIWLSDVRSISAALFLVVVPVSATAIETGIAPLGFTSALSTPTAFTLDTGEFGFAYTRYLDGRNVNNLGYNYVAGVGVLPGLEVFGRLATNTIADNCFTEGCGIRDLSVSAKYALPSYQHFFPEGLQPWLPQLAVGVTDVGGAATNFRTYYGVGTWSGKTWALSAGLSEAEVERTVSARLDGPFASLTLQPWPFVQAIAEYDGQDPQAGLRFMTQQGDLPGRITLQAEVRTGASRDITEDERSIWFGVAAKMPLGGDVAKPSYRAAWIAGQPAPTILPATPVAPKVDTANTQLDETLLVSRLINAGFQDVSVFWNIQGWQVRLENQAYAWNDLDALGVILGEYAHWSALQPAPVSLSLYKMGVSVLDMESDTACLLAYLQQGEACADGVLRYRATGWSGGPFMAGQHTNNSLYKPRLEFAPVVNYGIGTEFGAMDYSLGLATTLEVPVLWQGMMVEVRHTTELDSTKDFQGNGVFRDSRVKNGLDRILLHQYLAGPYGFSAHGAIGQVFHDFEGGFVEGRWQSPLGRHAVTAVIGEFEHRDTQVEAKPALLTYRYQFQQRDVQVGATAGEFFDADVGYEVSARFGFGDTFLTLFYRDTKFDNEDSGRSFAGAELSLPLTPRRNRPMAYGQLRGAVEQSQRLQTEVNNEQNRINGNNSRGRFVTVPQSLEQRVYNRDRLSPLYINQNLPRLRNAYERYLATAWRFNMDISQ